MKTLLKPQQNEKKKIVFFSLAASQYRKIVTKTHHDVSWYIY